ncbi:protein-L-isoaspartate(D-aspartate) O-methyltransferase [Thermomonospora echinospora]|uniref:Protein-L-isoaspartate O-methyltransferase n=1 Tax=Thermomonospora echinospora TaxID=1992 RepID=A0A1H6E9D0_9ACTN|nr:methyltransferase domain-containing protein [Thermomonospora echinospora]SEG93455.1 protein-L-isoaspartate(D-aspartate) O-methyltransferase [Thermomonospora echinospora]
MTGPAEPAARLIEDLTASGDLAAEWRPVFEAVPRHRFVPDTVWTEETGRLVPVRRADEPERWLELCYRNDFVITQVDDGRPAGPGPVGQEITSSASRPDVVALMLAALDAEPGMSVLEIGTGTGWNAALLAERLGAGRVTTVEIDPAVAEHARTALRRAGHDVTVVVGDGAQGYPPAAPYDRVIATAAVRRIPAAWARQTRPGGRVLVPWATDFHNGALVAFQVSADHTMRGRIVGNVAFMMLREQRGRRASLARDVYDVERAARSVTRLHPYDLLGEYDASLAVGLCVPRCKPVVEQHGEGAYTLWLIDPWSRSWACLSNRPGTDAFPVRQLGPRRLWDEVADAHHWWAGLGKPVAGRWGLTVTPAEQYVWLDTEDNRIAGPE